VPEGTYLKRKNIMALVSRFNGVAAPGAVYGYTPMVIKIAATAGFLASTGGAGSAIVEKGYDKAVRVLQQYGSIIWLSAQSDNGLTAIVDGATFNTEGGAYTTLKTALGAVKDAGTLTVSVATVFAGDGTFTFSTV
jgi:hypothetical protein